VNARRVRAVVLDVEGTTTPVAFVYDVLFPFAREHLRSYLRDQADSIALRDALGRLREEHEADVRRGETPPPWIDRDSSTRYLEWLMDRDRKSPALKLIQGLVWEEGFRTGVLRGDVFGDVPPALQRWQEARVAIAIYSSGSVLAQRLIFCTTPYGDLTGFISRFFDTAVGPKTSEDSYRRIAIELDCRTHELLFISDVGKELEPARAAGCQVMLSVRPGNRPESGDWLRIESFEDIVLSSEF
jgi:enolase-phosphatase E1